ncbi:MAG: aldo/keto reductase [Candidatus Adiutrix sp.]|jgi:aryl-alcohol dehydrogenase-like predicted oxidoreductase|nr:aldo/keto reductase [Candidatus Adiutrix sp.]
MMVTRVSMGCIPIQRLSLDGAVELLHRAFDYGINLYDTAHFYTDSEEKLGRAFSGAKRTQIFIATKTMSDSYEKAAAEIDESLRRLKTDYLDILQWHNPYNIDNFLEKRGPYQALLDAQKAGKARFLGFTNHHQGRTHAAIDSGVFDTIQYPASVLSTQEELDISFKCRDLDLGFIAMKGMAGGLLDDGRIPFAFLNQYPHIVPIWGLEKLSELEQFIRLAAAPEPFTEEMKAEAEKLRREYGDGFCRGCGYCQPCPIGLPLHTLMRVVRLIKRAAPAAQFTPERLADIQRIDDCQNCGHCRAHCPYNLDVPRVLKEQQAGYMKLYEEYQRGGQ